MNENTGVDKLAEFTHKLGVESRELKSVLLGVDNNKLPVAVLPENLKIVALEQYLPQHPARKEVDLMLTDPQSYCGYINEQKKESTRIFATFDTANGIYLFKAVIDYHGVTDKPADWCAHVVSLKLGLSDQFKAWKAINGKMFGQQAFAEFLKDNRLDIITPDNATIVELVEELEATVNQRVNGRTPTNKGMAIGFEQDVQTNRQGKKVDVPEKITIRVPVFLGMDSFEIECDFKFRTESGLLSFGIRMLAVDKLVRDTVLAAAETIRKETELPVYI
ncbi:MAG: DUF2303 family protein [Victivallaceae bacterium]|jgi:uncharacterized protein YfdQ (DUF2303 family)